MQTSFLGVALCFFLEFLLLYVPLMRASRATRLWAHAGFSFPWLVLLFIMPSGEIFLMGVAVALFAIPGELFVQAISRKKLDPMQKELEHI